MRKSKREEEEQLPLRDINELTPSQSSNESYHSSDEHHANKNHKNSKSAAEIDAKRQSK